MNMGSWLLGRVRPRGRCRGADGGERSRAACSARSRRGAPPRLRRRWRRTPASSSPTPRSPRGTGRARCCRDCSRQARPHQPAVLRPRSFPTPRLRVARARRRRGRDGVVLERWRSRCRTMSAPPTPGGVPGCLRRAAMRLSLAGAGMCAGGASMRRGRRGPVAHERRWSRDRPRRRDRAVRGHRSGPGLRPRPPCNRSAPNVGPRQTTNMRESRPHKGRLPRMFGWAGGIDGHAGGLAAP